MAKQKQTEDKVQLYHSLSSRKEKKLKIDYKKIESIVEEVLVKYEIDLKIEEFLYNEFQKKLNKDEIFTNINVLLGKEPSSKYKIQLNYDDFVTYKKKIYNLIKEAMDDDLSNIKKIHGEDDIKYIEHKEIYDNLFEEIQLTMFDSGVQRLTLVSFHYYIKVLEYFAGMYMNEMQITNIKRTKNVLEVFIKDLIHIISEDEELTRFLLTLKSLIEQWLTKYNAKTKIGEFYYDILMITPEHITERILKYLLFTAIKNKNPLTLRAIFSSYITLIHQNIFSFYAINLSKVRVGYFKQLDGLFTENFNLVFDESSNTSNTLIEIFLKLYITKKKKFMKNDFYIFNDEFTFSFFEPNYFEVIYSYNKSDSDNIPFIDHVYYYNKILKSTKLSYSDFSNYHKVNSKFFKNNNRKKFMNFIKEKLIENFFTHFYNIVGEKETVDEILTAMAKDISQKLNKNHFLDTNYNVINIDEKEFIKELNKYIDILGRKILG